MVDPENQTSRYQYQKDLMTSGKEHFQQEMIAEFPVLLHQETPHHKQF